MISIPKKMSAVLTIGHGGFDKLVFRNDVEVPKPKSDQVLIKVLGAGINNTDINTRTAWYSKSATDETNTKGSQGKNDDGSWSGEPLDFPIIQGADCYGEIVAVGVDVNTGRIGERVLVRTMQQYAVDYRPYECWTMGSECDGAFAEYMVAYSDESFKIESDWTNAELASIPCAYSTAENLLERSDVKKDEVVLITGASGGVGSAAIQLAKRRGARVVAIASKVKSDEVREIGFQFLAKEILVSHAYVHQVEVGIPVTVGGLTVSPGDLLHADQHGCVRIPGDIAGQVADAAQIVEDREKVIIDYCKSSDFSFDGLRSLYDSGTAFTAPREEP